MKKNVKIAVENDNVAWRKHALERMMKRDNSYGDSERCSGTCWE
ncbi:MAG: hypothetical protein ACUZ8O_11030 [Candidatus Anammoxibacter sp.]